MDRQAGDDAHIFGCKIGHQYASHRPVDYIHTADIARADGHVIAFVGTLFIKAWQVGRSMAEVGIHFEHIIVLMFDGPLETGDIGGSEPEFPLAFHHEEAVGELPLHPADDVGSAVGRVILDDEDVEKLFQSEYRPDDVLDVLLFVIGRYDDNAI